MQIPGLLSVKITWIDHQRGRGLDLFAPPTIERCEDQCPKLSVRGLFVFKCFKGFEYEQTH